MKKNREAHACRTRRWCRQCGRWKTRGPNEAQIWRRREKVTGEGRENLTNRERSFDVKGLLVIKEDDKQAEDIGMGVKMRLRVRRNGHESAINISYVISRPIFEFASSK